MKLFREKLYAARPQIRNSVLLKVRTSLILSIATLDILQSSKCNSDEMNLNG